MESNFGEIPLNIMIGIKTIKFWNAMQILIWTIRKINNTGSL